MKGGEPPLVTVRWGGGMALQFIGWGACFMAAMIFFTAVTGGEMRNQSAHRMMTFFEMLRLGAKVALVGIAAVWGGRRIRRLQDAQEDRDREGQP